MWLVPRKRLGTFVVDLTSTRQCRIPQNPLKGVTGGASGQKDPCAGLKASDLNYGKERFRGYDKDGNAISENGIDHITRRHILLDDPSKGFLTQNKLPILAQGSSKYVFQDNVTTLSNAQNLVVRLNAVVFEAAKDDYSWSRGNIVMTVTFPAIPKSSDEFFAGIGYDLKQGFGTPSNSATLILGRDCREVITAYPGRP